jgi:malonyl-CoA/methylmalonyl-CoA synthetase
VSSLIDVIDSANLVLFPLLQDSSLRSIRESSLRERDAGAHDVPAMRFPGGALTWTELRDAVAAVAGQVEGCQRVALWAEPTIETAVGVIGALVAGVTVVPINPSIGSIELEHILGEAKPDAILRGRDAVGALPVQVNGYFASAGSASAARSASARSAGSDERYVIDVNARAADALPAPPDAEAPALIIYTSGTTGLPKGAVLSYRAIAANLDGLAEVWRWTARDVLVHALPLFHVHGLVLGTLGPVRVGSPLVHVGKFSPEGIATALASGGTMLFGVPTMYHRLAKAAEAEAEAEAAKSGESAGLAAPEPVVSVVSALADARLLVSGSAPLAAQDRDIIQRLTGKSPIERYGLTETLIVCAMPPSAAGTSGVGPPVPGVDVRLVDDDGNVIPAGTTGTPDALGEVEVRGASLFHGYLDRPDATDRAHHDGWFRTGDTAVRDADGFYTIVGRTALDVIKTGGFKVGAGEVEDALRLHPDVAEVAVTGESDDDLGQRIAAWVVLHPGCSCDAAAIQMHVAGLLSSHKRPRIVRFLDALPRNAMGKVEKRKLTTTTA